MFIFYIVFICLFICSFLTHAAISTGSGVAATTLGLTYAVVRECAMAVWERLYPDPATGSLVPRWKLNKTTRSLKFSHKWVIGLLKRVQQRGEGASLVLLDLPMDAAMHGAHNGGGGGGGGGGGMGGGSSSGGSGGMNGEMMMGDGSGSAAASVGMGMGMGGADMDDDDEDDEDEDDDSDSDSEVDAGVLEQHTH
jgi:uncharacterized membrane protein YgcG